MFIRDAVKVVYVMCMYTCHVQVLFSICYLHFGSRLEKVPLHKQKGVYGTLTAVKSHSGVCYV